ncbi:hypothetical protein DPMN_106790 [Dreissena polymorpha]|uniref:Uncharacterized protein n=1 Tax=Dreissena polymorpha TaxID=45954 RepID=A0A9D4K5K1_DREPO|nr:hypothetical protein DPMN_106790 [Dreissena polymorpha]
MHVYLMGLHILSGERSRSSFKVKVKASTINKKEPGIGGIMVDAMIMITHTVPVPKNSSTPHKRGSKRAISTPTRKTPKHEHKRIKLDEKNRHNKWSIEEKSFLKEYSQKLRKDGESENSFWDNCAIVMNNMFGGKKTEQVPALQEKLQGIYCLLHLEELQTRCKRKDF